MKFTCDLGIQWTQWHTLLFEGQVAVDMESGLPAGCEEDASEIGQDSLLEEVGSQTRNEELKELIWDLGLVAKGNHGGVDGHASKRGKETGSWKEVGCRKDFSILDGRTNICGSLLDTERSSVLGGAQRAVANTTGEIRTESWVCRMVVAPAMRMCFGLTPHRRVYQVADQFAERRGQLGGHDLRGVAGAEQVQNHERIEELHRGGQPRGGPDDRENVRIDASKRCRRSAASFINTAKVEVSRVGPPLVDEDWHAVCQAIYDVRSPGGSSRAKIVGK